MHPEDIPTGVVVPRERSEDQGLLLKHMSQLNQRLLGPWENADGQRLPRLTLAEAVAQLYEWSTAYGDHPELARDFAVRSYWIPGSYIFTLSERRNPFLRPLKKKGFKEERITTMGVYDIGTSHDPGI
jgi:hypothetical protein